MFKRRQIVVLALILVIIVAGYLQYTYKNSSQSAGSKDNNIGEAIFVDSKAGTTTNNIKTTTATTTTQKTTVGASSDQKAISGKTGSDFFAKAKLDRDTSRSKNLELLRSITVDANATKEIKSEAYNKIMAMSSQTESEMKIEALIKEKGYSDAIVLFADDGSVDIVVQASGLTSAETTQIADIVSRQAKVSMDSIHIRNNL